MANVLILGATSAIAQATARRFAREGARLYLVARDGRRLASVADDLRSRGAEVAGTTTADLADPAEHARVVAAAVAALGDLTHALIAHGVLPDPARATADPLYARESLEVNFLSSAALALHLASYFERQGAGCLAVIGSVAGDRIRVSNYVYGTAKGALALFLDGLRARLAASNVRVITVKPGFVDTPMTAGLRKGPLFASADAVGAGIHRAMAGSRSGTIYLPGFWRWIMLGVRLIPTSILRRLPI
jgi:decaprenylphospho-beta-D-erythro-pentofuranosid-2-ulose 2-reductase